MPEKKSLLWTILLVNLLLSLVYLAGSGQLAYVPRHEYTELAVNVAAGRGYNGTGFFCLGYGPSAFLGPVYTWLLAGAIYLYKLPLAYLAIRLLQACLNPLICLLLYLVAKNIFGRSPALVAAALFACYAPFLHWATEIWDTTLFTAAVLGLVYLAQNKPFRDNLSSFGFGLYLGFCALINSVVLAFIPVLAGFLLARADGGAKQRVGQGLLVGMLGMILVIAPWSIRNSVTFKAFVPLRTGFWLNLYLGNNPDATGTVYLKHLGRVPADFNVGITEHFRPLIGALSSLNEQGQDQFLKERFLRFVRSEPLLFLKLLAAKSFYFVWFNGYERTPRLFVAQYGLVLFLGLIGYYFSWRERKRVGLISFLLAAFTGVYVLTGPFFNFKYRLPVEPYLIMLAGYGLSSFIDLVVSTTREARPSLTRPGRT